MKVVIESLDPNKGHLLATVDTEVDTDVEEAAKSILRYHSGGAVFAGKEGEDLTLMKASTVDEAKRIVREHERIMLIPQFQGG